MVKKLLLVFGIFLFAAPLHTFAGSCPALVRSLSVGARGADVIELQQYLISQNALASGYATGYFGLLTQAAVQSWQAKNSIVSGGTPATTGYGSVGPRTRLAIANVCAVAQTVTNPPPQTALGSSASHSSGSSSHHSSGSSHSSSSSVAPLEVTNTSPAKKLIDSTDNGYSYAYAPSILQIDGTKHMFYCSSGTGTIGWDQIRHATSEDGLTWSTPTVALTTSDGINERASCDPSVVYYDAGDGPYYYLFYSGNQKDTQTVNFVARSSSINGPFLKLTTRGTWEANAADPKIILSPIHHVPDTIANAAGWYGLGQPSVVVKDGKLYQWYTDDTSGYPGSHHWNIYLSVSSDPTTWPAGTPTNVLDTQSVDVKYDAVRNQFVMFSIYHDLSQSDSVIQMRTSPDGITWSSPETVTSANEGTNPGFIHNIGVAGDSSGSLIPGFFMVAYGAPFDLVQKFLWGMWDMYGQYVSLNNTRTPSEWNRADVKPAVAWSTSQSNDVLTNWPVSNAIDGNPSTAYSSNPFTTDQNDRGSMYVAYIRDFPASISQVSLTSRVKNGVTNVGFPKQYAIYVTNQDNTNWVYTGTYTTQPDSTGVATIDLGKSYITDGIQIIPTTIGVDLNGNHYFQLAEVSAR